MASVLIEERLEVPSGITSLEDFRRWAVSENFPEAGRIDFIAGRIEVDMSPESLFSHGTLKGKVYSVLLNLVETANRGYLFVDRTRVSCPDADVSVEPDIVFLSHERLDDGRVQLVPKASGKSGEYIEIEGPPDLIVEIVSDSSVAKDTRRLPERYFHAGAGEFWLIDARREQLVFQIQSPGENAFEPVSPSDDGSLFSQIFQRSFRLSRRADRRGNWVYELDMNS
jgi:Uma2 family endonuclease